MNVGKLYEIKKYFWLLYPSKDIAAAAARFTPTITYASLTSPAAQALTRAAYLSNRFKCNVSYIEPNSIFCLLEKDGKFIKILSTNGELGWFYLANWCKEDIEEVNQ